MGSHFHIDDDVKFITCFSLTSYSGIYDREIGSSSLYVTKRKDFYFWHFVSNYLINMRACCNRPFFSQSVGACN
jgi:hypothetical protein